jgi:hypothetical protein
MVDDALINEWARSRNGIIPGPATMHHAGRNGQHGEWPIAAYRRLLAAIRLREEGLTDVSTLRLRLRFAGQRVDDSHAPGDIARAYDKVLRQARREVPLLPGGRLTTAPPLRLRREVQKAVSDFRSGRLGVPPGLGGGWLERLRDHPDLEFICVALADLMYRGPEKPVLDRLQEVARLLPRWLFDSPGDIIEATASTAGALAPADECNTVVDALKRAGPVDVQMADAFMARIPKLLQWVEDNHPRVNSCAEDYVREICILARSLLSIVPLEGRVIWHAWLIAQYVRYREGSVSWAPGVEFVNSAA